MKFSKRSTYGLRAMARLAKFWGNKNVSLSEVSEMEQISKKYLEQIFILLRGAKLVEAEKGQHGGYRLSRDPSEISVFDIVEALEGGVKPSGCISGKGEFTCEKSSGCGVVSLLLEIQKSVIGILKSKNLSEIAKKHK